MGRIAEKYIKARCAKHDKWFTLELENVHGTLQVVNFVGMTKEESHRVQTEVSGTSFRAAPSLRRCCKCATDKVGTCKHVEGLRAGGKSLCEVPYSYQCLFCEHLRISGEKVRNDAFNEWVGISNIPGATKDRFGNPQGSQFDLAKDGGFKGQKLIFLCLLPGEILLQNMHKPIAALEKKGFEVDLCRSVTPEELKSKLQNACQLWVIADRVAHLDARHLAVIRSFYEKGGGLYLWGDNDPFYVDANMIAKALVNVTMKGNYHGDKIIGVQDGQNDPGIIQGHPITTGIVNLYEGITIATVQTNKKTVKPLVISSDGNVVTAYVDDGKHRMLIDGGSTRLDNKWESAGTDRFVVNCAAWLAESSGGAAEQRFT